MSNRENKMIFKSIRNDSLLNILKDNISGSSNKTIKNYIKHKMVLVDGEVVVNPNYDVLINSEITVYFTMREIPNYELKIIYEDDDLIAIDKPSGLLSISNNKEKEITAFRLVSDYIKGNNKNAKLFVVHRLDQDTSGVLLFSKNLKLKEEMQKRWNEIVKLREYYCVVKGKTPKRDKIESYLTMNHFQIVHSTRNKEVGHLAITRYEQTLYKNTYSLLRVEIDTGRRNQIRAHLSEQGYPIIGDKKYGASVNPIGRLGLHASKLIITDVRTGKDLVLKSNVPDEIINIVS